MAAKLDPRTKRAVREIGRRIKSVREEAGLSQEKLAAKIGMTRSNYARIERGATNVTIDTLIRIAKGLGVDVRVTIGDVYKGDS